MADVTLESLASEVQKIKDHFGLDSHWEAKAQRLKVDIQEALTGAQRAQNDPRYAGELPRLLKELEELKARAG